MPDIADSPLTRPSAGDAFDRVAALADSCPGYGMCRIDFLGTGVCPSAKRLRFAAYYPQGRMLAISAFRRGVIPLTRKLADIALSCQECGSCDKQCYFVAGLRAGVVFKAFKDKVRLLRSELADSPRSEFLTALAAVVGDEWCSQDPAVLASYARARSPAAEETPPSYVALPATAEETAALVRLCRRHGIPFVPRGSATSLGGALTRGLVIDLVRMDRITIDPRRCCATVGPGVYAFDLQTEAAKHGLRANVAEPAASVCANVICTNMHSFFSYSYGVGSDHFIDAQFVSPEGTLYRLSDENAPNPFFLRKGARSPLGICTEMEIRLHPICPDETSVLIPCGSVEEAVALAREIARRRIGIGLGVIGVLYLSIFASSTAAAVPRILDLLENHLGIRAMVLVLGERNSLAAIASLTPLTLDGRLASMLLRALPTLDREPGFCLLTELGAEESLYKEIFSPALQPLLEMALRSSLGTAHDDVDEDMRDFFSAFYARPESTDPVWLNNFRILPARMGRDRQFVSKILYYDLSDPGQIVNACLELGRVGDRHNLKHGFGYLLPFADGTRAVMEYDYYFDRTDPEQVESMRKAMDEAAAVVRELHSSPGFVCSGETVFMQGLCRSESYLFGT